MPVASKDAQFWEAYRKGLTDKEAGKELGCGALAFGRWRRWRGLPSATSVEFQSPQNQKARQRVEPPPYLFANGQPIESRNNRPAETEPVMLPPVAISRGSDWHLVPREGQYWLQDVETASWDPWTADPSNPVGTFMANNDLPPALLFKPIGNAQTHLLASAPPDEDLLVFLAPGLRAALTNGGPATEILNAPKLGLGRAFKTRLAAGESILIETTDGDAVAEIGPIVRPRLVSPGLTDLGGGFAVSFAGTAIIEWDLPEGLDGRWFVAVSKWNGPDPIECDRVSSRAGSPRISFDLERYGPGRLRLDVLDTMDSLEPLTALTLFWDPRVAGLRVEGFSPVPPLAGFPEISIFGLFEDAERQVATALPDVDLEEMAFRLVPGDESTWVRLSTPTVWWRVGGKNPGAWSDLPMTLTAKDVDSGVRLDFKVPLILRPSFRLISSMGEDVLTRHIDEGVRAIASGTLKQLSGDAPRSGFVSITVRAGGVEALAAKIWGQRVLSRA